MATNEFSAQLAANDREHVERLEAIAADLERHARDARWQYPGIASLFDRGALRIRVELARWKRPHPLEGKKPWL